MPPDMVRVQALAGGYIRKADRYENLPVLAGKPNFNSVR